MANPKNTSGGNIIDNNVELINISDDVNFSAPQYDPPCPPGIFTADSDSIYFAGSGSTCDPLTANLRVSLVHGNNLVIFDDGAYVSGGTGGGTVTLLNDGLTLSGNTGILGGVILADKILDFATNTKNIWFKAPLVPVFAPTVSARHTVIMGSLNSSPWTNYDSTLLISKASNDNNGNCVFLSMVTGDGTGINGWQFLNYTDAPGEFLPNLRVASNATAGGSSAFNLDLIGRDSRSDFSHFSIWYYDYDQYVASGNNAGPMTNSNLINFTNGSGGNAETCVNFFFVDKHYNFMIGKHAFSYRPAGALDIGDNGSTYSIYQQGANSSNWFAGKTKIGGLASVASVQLEINAASGKTLVEPFVKFNNGSASEIGRINFTDTDTFVGINSGAANQNTSGQNAAFGGNAAADLTTGNQNAIFGFNAGAQITSSRQNTILGAYAGRGITSGNRGNVLIGIITGDLTGGDPGAATIGDFNTIVGSEAAAMSVGGVIGSGNIIMGTFTYNGTPVISNDNILIGNSQFSTSSIVNSIYIVSNPDVAITLSNVVVIGDDRHNTILGATGTISDSGDRLQVYGTIKLTSLPSSTNAKTLVAWDNVTNKLVAIAASGITSIPSWDQTLAVSNTTARTFIQTQPGALGTSAWYQQYTTKTAGTGTYNVFMDDSFTDGGGVTDNVFTFHSYNYPVPGHTSPVAGELQYRFAVERKWLGTRYQTEFHIPEYVTTTGVVHRLNSLYVGITDGSVDQQVEFDQLKVWSSLAGGSHAGDPSFAFTTTASDMVHMFMIPTGTQFGADIRLYGNTSTYNGINYNISSGLTVECFTGNLFLHTAGVYGPSNWFFNQGPSSTAVVNFFTNVTTTAPAFRLIDGNSVTMMEVGNAISVFYGQYIQSQNTDPTLTSGFNAYNGTGYAIINNYGTAYATTIGIANAGDAEFGTTGMNNLVIQTRDSKPIKFGINAVQVGTIKPSGQWQLNKYGAGTFTGTLAKSLGVDSSGNIIESSLYTANTRTTTLLTDTFGVTDYSLFVDSTSGNTNISLTPATLSKHLGNIKKISSDTNVITITATAGLIYYLGAPTATIVFDGQGENRQFHSDGTNIYIL